MQISYPDVFTLMEHLAQMGEGTASINRQYAVGSDTFLAMASIYQGEAQHAIQLEDRDNV